MFAFRPSAMIYIDILEYSAFLKGQFVNLLMSVLDMTKQRASDTLQVRGSLIRPSVDGLIISIGQTGRRRAPIISRPTIEVGN